MTQNLILLSAVSLLISTTTCSQKLAAQAGQNGEGIVIDGQMYQTIEGFMEVPEDYQNPSSRKLQLPFLVIKSPAQTPAAPIFWLDGGPGGSNMVSRKNIASSSPSKLLANHDFVCIGYRGVDGSTVLKSEKINKAMKGGRHKMLSEQSLKHVEREIKEYYSDLKREGVDLNNFTIMQVVEDLEHARKLLGYNSINLLSVSYGTRVALMYSYRHPESLHRTMMIGACPPGYFLPRPEHAEQVLNVYDSIYKAQNPVGYKGSIKVAMKKSFDHLPKRWSIFRLDADKIKAGTTGALYIRGFAVIAFDAYFKAANEGDYSGLYMLQKIYDMNSNLVIGDVFAKTVSADMSDTLTDAALPKTLRDTTTILGDNTSTIYREMAGVWPIKSIPQAFKKCRMSASETLVVSGDLDFRTPAKVTSKALMPYLTKGQHIVLKNMSHTDILMNVMKSPQFLQAWFDAGLADQSLIPAIDSINFTPSSNMAKWKIFGMGLIK